MRKSQRAAPAQRSAKSRALRKPARSLPPARSPPCRLQPFRFRDPRRAPALLVAPGFVTGMLAGLQRRGLDATPPPHAPGSTFAENRHAHPGRALRPANNLCGRHLKTRLSVWPAPRPAAWSSFRRVAGRSTLGEAPAARDPLPAHRDPPSASPQDGWRARRSW